MNWKDILCYLSFEFSMEPGFSRSCFYKSVLVAAYRPACNGGYMLTLYSPDGSVFLYMLHSKISSIIYYIALHVFDLIVAGELPPLEE